VLNEEVLSASSAHLALRAAIPDDAADDTPRYSEAAGVENHPQVTDFLPRRFGTIILLTLSGLGSIAALLALDRFALPVLAEYAPEAARVLDLAAPGNLAAWLATVLNLTAASVCFLIYSLRRHRIDDIRGRYRVWLAAGLACILTSVNCAASLHRLITAVAIHYVGWTALRDGSVWWLAIAGLPLAWIALRAWFDARESRLAAVALSAAFASYGVSLGSYLAAWPANLPNGEVLVSAGAALLGHWMLFVGIVSYGRFVVLDAQGLVPVRQRNRPREKHQEKTAMGEPPTISGRAVAHRLQESTPQPPRANTIQAFRQNLKSSESKANTSFDETRWIDGSEPVDDEFNEEGPGPRDRKLSKAERKRLRKLKARNRAA
jgi:hypothetical protein